MKHTTFLQFGSLLGFVITPAWSIVHHNTFPLLSSFSSPERLAQLETRATKKGHLAHNLSIPVDHFHNETKYEPHSNNFFDLRYWFDGQYYKKGGPVIVLAAGEVSGLTRLPFLEHGIAHILAKETNGVAVILEHRYYGTSFPVPNVTVENLRFLDTEQALADTAYFAEHIIFPGLEDHDLTAGTTPWIIYGGSYAGAFAALARKIYPEAFWGGISSSGVTAAIVNYWQYHEAARLYAPGACANNTALVVDVIDSVLLGKQEKKAQQLKDSFGLGFLSNSDFGKMISVPLYGLQSTNWDFNEEGFDWGHFCGVVQSQVTLYSSVQHLQGWVNEFVELAGYTSSAKDKAVVHVLNYIGYLRDYLRKVEKGACKDVSRAACYNRYSDLNSTKLPPDSSFGRSWTYQTCTQ